MKLLLKALACYTVLTLDVVIAQDDEGNAPQVETPPPPPPPSPPPIVQPPAPPPPVIPTTTTTTTPESEENKKRRLEREAVEGAAQKKFDLSHELCMAAVDGDVDWVKRMLAAGADPNFVPNSEGWAAVHSVIIAAHNPQWKGIDKLMDIMKLLIDAKADLHQPDIHDRQPLIHAIEIPHVHADIIALFKGGDLERINPQGEQTPLQRAIGHGHHTVAEKLMEMGATLEDRLDRHVFEKLHRLKAHGNIKVPDHIKVPERYGQVEPERSTKWARRLFKDELPTPAQPPRQEPAQLSSFTEKSSDL